MQLHAFAKCADILRCPLGEPKEKPPPCMNSMTCFVEAFSGRIQRHGRPAAVLVSNDTPGASAAA